MVTHVTMAPALVHRERLEADERMATRVMMALAVAHQELSLTQRPQHLEALVE